MQLPRTQQISESHCGPAVLQMLLGSIGMNCTQDQIVRAAGIGKTLEENGSRIDQLALATRKLAPKAQFWYKYMSTLDDIQYILSRGYAVGVEWQGLFYESEEEEEEDDAEDADHGHYSIISFVDETEKRLIIVDPYKKFAHQDRIFKISTFLKRWWDTNDITEPYTKRKDEVVDKQLLFFVTPSTEELPEERKFQRF